ncbi:MAG: DUF5011 domain-containing protein [Acholeplasmataceae bacterium]|nr:DUF5011 domain-containing protein [Acholeplasmataceae bacterium]
MKFKLLIILLVVLMMTGCVEGDPESLSITLNPGTDTIEVNSSFLDAGAKATLNITRSHPVEVVENTVDITQVGTYRIVYETTYQNVTRSIFRVVHVVDETPPQIFLNSGVDTIFVNDVWEDAGVEVIDQSGLAVSLTVTGEVNISMIGEYQIYYIATDAFGNQSAITRYVSVIARPTS